jgi:hypothetical protein
MQSIQSNQLCNVVLRNTSQWTHYAEYTPVGHHLKLPFFVDFIAQIKGRGGLRCRYDDSEYPPRLFTWVTRDGGTPQIHAVASPGRRLIFEIRSVQGYSIEITEALATFTCDPTSWSSFSKAYPRQWWALLHPSSHRRDVRSYLSMISSMQVTPDMLEELWELANMLEGP